MRLLKLPVRNTLWIFSYTRLSRIIRDAQPTTIRLFCDHEPFGHQLSTCAWRFAAPLGVAAVAWYLCLLKHFGSDVLHFRLAQTQRNQEKKQSETPWITGKTKTSVWSSIQSPSIPASMSFQVAVVFGSFQAKRKTAIRLMLQRNVARIIASSLLTQHPSA